MRSAMNLLLPLLILTAIAPRAGSTELGDSPFSLAPKAQGPARALAVAHEDFVRRLPPPREDVAAMERFASDPDSYAIAIERDGVYYIVDYSIKPYQGQSFRGGGYRYRIDGSDFRIVDARIEP
uniref:Putative exported protein n=1 Tax=Lysobacter sp. ATCC 53042 TaxID=324869 RepID=F8TUB6_9GAMM|nr:putative exported protein [Lysobacter sp. ATCC 53042]